MLGTTPTIQESLGAMGGAGNVQASINAGNSLYRPPSGPVTLSASSIGDGSNISSYKPVTSGTATNALGATVNGKVGAATTADTNSNVEKQGITGNATTPNGTIVDSKSGSTVTSAPNPVTPTTADTSSSGGILDYLKYLIGIDATKGDVTQQDQEAEGLAGKTQAASDASTALTSAKAGLAAQVAQIQSDPTLTKTQAAANVAEVQRTGNQNLANLSIILDAANNNVTAANDIINQKVSAQFDSVEANIKNMESLYTLSQNDMSDSEKEQAQAAIATAKTKSDALQTAYSTALKNAVQNSAPASVLSAIDKAASDPNATEATIDKAAGSYGYDPTTASTIAYQTSEIQKNISDNTITPAQIATVMQGLNTYAGTPYVTPTDLANFSNNNQKSSFQMAATTAGLKTLTADESKAMTSYQTAISDNESMMTAMQTLLPTGPSGQPLQAAAVTWNKFISSSPALAAFDSWKAAATVDISALKGVGGGSGGSARLLTAFSNALPTATDTVEEAQIKIQTFNTLFDNGAKAILGQSSASSTTTTVAKGTSGTINGKNYTYNGTGDTSDINNWTVQP